MMSKQCPYCFAQMVEETASDKYRCLDCLEEFDEYVEK